MHRLLAQKIIGQYPLKQSALLGRNFCTLKLLQFFLDKDAEILGLLLCSFLVVAEFC